MRNALALSLSATLLLLGAACGDDGETSSGPGGGGTGAGSTASVGGGGEGGGTPTGARVGEACTTDDDCLGGICITESLAGWAEGYCSGLCDPTLAPCPDGQECVALGTGGALCLDGCSDSDPCTGTAQTCVDIGFEEPQEVCLGGCDADDQCVTACDDDSLVCVDVGEECSGGDDEDGDGLVDCEELDCAADATCISEIGDACDGAVAITASGSLAGDTAGGTNSFSALCPSLFGSYSAGAGMNENLYVFSPTEASAWSFKVVADDEDDTLDLYLRSDCDDRDAFLGCASSVAADDDAISLEVAAGESLFLFVDAYGTNASYTIESVVTPIGPLCEDDAQAINLGTTNGNTTNGSSALSSSCGGGGNEAIYTYTPAASGMLDITLSSATDQGISVRTDCADIGSEVECADAEFGGTDETLTVAVTANETITIIVDGYSAGEEGPFSLLLE